MDWPFKKNAPANAAPEKMVSRKLGKTFEIRSVVRGSNITVHERNNSDPAITACHCGIAITIR